MKTICGVTIRGAAYFGATVHICIGLLFFVLFVDQMVNQTYYSSFEMTILKVDKEDVIYFGIFLPLGFLMFKAIDKENKTLLKWTAGIFLMLQLFGLMIKMRFGQIQMAAPKLMITEHGPYTSTTPSTIAENLKMFLFEVGSTIAYLITLYLYARQLHYYRNRMFDQDGIPMYSAHSTFFTDHRSSHRRHGSHRQTTMTTPFTYNFEPPPPYSSLNDLTNSNTTEGTPNSGFGNSPQPSTSRSVFHNIGRIGSISFKKSAHSLPRLNLPNQPNASASNGAVPPPHAHEVVVANNASIDLNSNPNSHHSDNVAQESDLPSAPLLNAPRQNDLSVTTSDGRSRHIRLLNVKHVD